MKTGRRDFSGGFCNSWTRGIVFCCEVSLAKMERKTTILCSEFRVLKSAAERGRRYEGESLRKEI